MVIAAKQKQRITSRHPGDLKPHPLLARITTLPEMASLYEKRAKDGGKARAEHLETAEEVRAEFAALVESVRLHGVREPLRVSGDLIVDGRHRWLAALEAGVTVPTVEVDDSEIPEVIQDAVTRRHFTKGALAYMTVILHPEIAAAKRGNPQLGNEKTIENSQLHTECAIGDWAKKIGVHRNTMVQATELYRLVSRYKSQQEKTDAAVWAGAGLGALISGIKANKDKLEAGEEIPGEALQDKRVIQYEKLAVRTVTSIGTVFENWQKIPEEWQDYTLDKLSDSIAALQPGTFERLVELAREKAKNR